MLKAKSLIASALATLAFSVPSFATFHLPYESSQEMTYVVMEGSNQLNGWPMKNKAAMTQRLHRNEAVVYVSGTIWQDSANTQVTSINFQVKDANSSLTSSSYMGLLMGKNRGSKNANLVSMFKLLNSELDNWYESGQFDKAIKQFHSDKVAMRSQN